MTKPTERGMINYKLSKKWWSSHSAWAITDKKGNLFWTDKEPCIYESYNVAIKNKGLGEVRSCHMFIRRSTKQSREKP